MVSIQYGNTCQARSAAGRAGSAAAACDSDRQPDAISSRHSRTASSRRRTAGQGPASFGAAARQQACSSASAELAARSLAGDGRRWKSASPKSHSCNSHKRPAYWTWVAPPLEGNRRGTNVRPAARACIA